MTSRRNNTEEWISHMENRIMEITQSEQYIEKWKKKNQSNRWDLWDNINKKHANLHIIGVPERGERQQGMGNISEDFMAVDFPNFKKETFR